LKDKPVNIIAVFPQELTVAKKFLSQSGLESIQVRAGSPIQLGIRATPTVLFVNSTGIVVDVVQGAGHASATEIARKMETMN